MVFLLQRQGLHFPICVDSSLKRGPGEGGGVCVGGVGSGRQGGRRGVGSAAICCFTFQIIQCDRANVLLQSAQQYAQPWLSVSQQNVRMSQKDSLRVTLKKSPLLFQRMYISCNDMCSDSHKSSPTALFSMETDAAWFFLTAAHTQSHDACRRFAFQHREKSVRNHEMSCG